ncbi:hypothetical protein [Micromonospora sp. NPDC004704]
MSAAPWATTRTTTVRRACGRTVAATPDPSPGRLAYGVRPAHEQAAGPAAGALDPRYA